MADKCIYVVFHGTTPSFATPDKDLAETYVRMHTGIFPARVEPVPLMTPQRLRTLIEETSSEDIRVDMTTMSESVTALAHSATSNGRFIKRTGCPCRSCTKDD